MQDALTARLEKSGRYAWFESDTRSLVDIARYRTDPERLYLRVPGAMRMNRRELGILREVAQLRDNLARERDVPLKYIIPDDVMAGIVSLRPATRDDLAQLRRLDAGARKAYGDRIVAAVAAGIAVADDDLPRKPPRTPGRRSRSRGLVSRGARERDRDGQRSAAGARRDAQRARTRGARTPRFRGGTRAYARRGRLACEFSRRAALRAHFGCGRAHDFGCGAQFAAPSLASPSLRPGGTLRGSETRGVMQNAHPNSFAAKSSLRVGDRTYTIFRLDAVEKVFPGVARLPFSLKILLENLVRFEDDRSVTKSDIEALAQWDPAKKSDDEIAYRPARVLLQDFTGVPCVVDLAAMRDAMAEMGGDPKKINPLQPVELVIDHSVQVDHFGSDSAFAQNANLEFERNRERYAFLKWGQHALDNFRAVPPDTGIVHQVNIEFLGRVVFGAGGAGVATFDENGLAYPDTVVGTDSHTTMANGLGILAWGVGGIEAEAAMLGQPVTMLVPDVIGFKLTGKLNEGMTSTDLVLARHGDLAEKGRRRQVRRVLRRGSFESRRRRPRDDRQHVAGIRLDRRDLPDRRPHALVSASDGSHAGADRARRSVRARARIVPHGCVARSGLYRHGRARSLDRRPRISRVRAGRKIASR